MRGQRIAAMLGHRGIQQRKRRRRAAIAERHERSNAPGLLAPASTLQAAGNVSARLLIGSIDSLPAMIVQRGLIEQPFRGTSLEQVLARLRRRASAKQHTYRIA